MKDRNPIQALRALQIQEIEKTLNQDIIQLLFSFNTLQNSIAEFFREAIIMMDQKGFSNTDIIEYILSNTKTKDYFKDLEKGQTTPLINSLLHSLNTNNQYQNKDSCIRMLGHICFEQNDIENYVIQNLYNGLSKFSFDASTQANTVQQNTGGGSGSSQNNQGSQKIQRLAINCIANMILKQSQFIKQNIEQIYFKLKGIFDQLMRKIQTNFKSKRFIQTMATVIRALQISIIENQKLQINDNEAAKLFLNFYKLLFLGSPFAEKMLQIKLEEAKTAKLQNQMSGTNDDEEEVKGDSGGFIIDTSDFSASSDVGDNKNSPSGIDGAQTSSLNDPYQKIKNYAVLCLQHLFKANNKALFNYWYLLFPSYFMRPQSDFTQYLYSFNGLKYEEFKQKSLTQIMREPTLFYLLNSKENNYKLKCTICFTIGVLLENSIIQKWQGQLEKDDQLIHKEAQTIQSFVSISNILGQFLRFLHYQLLVAIDNEQDLYLLQQLIKTTGTLMHITPYKFMQKGLVSHIFESFVQILISQGQVDITIKQTILSSLALAFNLTDIKDEIKEKMLSQDKKQINLLHYLLKKDNNKNETFSLKESQDGLNLLQRIGKNFPQELLEVWDSHLLGFFNRILQYQDRKKITQCFKIIEEWLRNFQTSSSSPDEDEIENQEEEKKNNQENLLDSPFKHDSFKEFLMHIVDQYFNNKESNDINIAILSILSSLNSLQWEETFDDNFSRQLLDHAFTLKQPAVLKAASIKLFGYLIYLEKFKNDDKFIDKVFSSTFENASDTNLNVQVRNSWALANLCCLKEKFSDPYLIQESLKTCINYAFSNKEKVIANSVRALGYLLAHSDFSYLENEILPLINKSQIFLNKLSPSVFSSKGSRNLSIDNILKIIVSNIENKSPKISWNACVSIGHVISNQSLKKNSIIYQEETLTKLLNTMVNRPNYKTRIHAAQTLMKFQSIEQFGWEKNIGKIWNALMNSLQSLNQLSGISSSEQKFIPQLEKCILELWVHVSQMTVQCESMQTFLNDRSLNLLQSITDYLRKELKVPFYSGFYDDMEIFQKETEMMFKENPSLEAKLNQLKIGIKKIRDLINDHEHIHVSFGVYEGLNSLAESDVKDYRKLEVLKMVKSSFEPKFDDKQ